MEREEKQLLLKDLCARLPYGVKVQSSNGEISILINPPCVIQDDNFNFKPYLRPMSSMTEEEKAYFFAINEQPVTCIDWLNSHHFDYRGLIEKGLAIEVTDENNPYKNN